MSSRPFSHGAAHLLICLMNCERKYKRAFENFLVLVFQQSCQNPVKGVLNNFLSLKQRKFIEDLQHLKTCTTSRSRGGVGGSIQ